MSNYTLVKSVLEEIDIPEKGFLSRTIHNDDNVKILLFSFAARAELAAHKAPMPVVIQILQGEAAVTIGDDRHPAAAGCLICLPADLIHSITANSPVRMMLSLLKAPSLTATIG